MIDVNPEAAVRFSCPGCSSSACKKSWMMSLCGMSQCSHNDAIRLHVPNIQCAKNWRWMEEAADSITALCSVLLCVTLQMLLLNTCMDPVSAADTVHRFRHHRSCDEPLHYMMLNM